MLAFFHQVSTLEVAHHHMHCICEPPWAWRVHGVHAPPRDSHLCASMGKSMRWFYFKENLKCNKKRSNIAYKLIICLNYKGKKCERNKRRVEGQNSLGYVLLLSEEVVNWTKREPPQKKKTKQNKTNKTPQKREKREKNKCDFVEEGRNGWIVNEWKE